ncbi:hypothetical protein TWF970_010767 [Orbilia oligospora]|uniref:Uncharacterized protein n=1 Tax=Orbilia oligospora TaxID=2813651 RepID=A0A7C8V2B6_ORBOL|nr:hypothetical protein TWF970_010767 [Orbilia oligospora]
MDAEGSPIDPKFHGLGLDNADSNFFPQTTTIDKIASDSGYATISPVVSQLAKISNPGKEKLLALLQILDDFKDRLDPIGASDMNFLQGKLQSLRIKLRAKDQEIRRLKSICRDQKILIDLHHRDISELDTKRKLTLDYFDYTVEADQKIRDIMSRAADLEAEINKVLTQRIQQLEEIAPGSPLAQQYWVDANIELFGQIEVERKSLHKERLRLDELEGSLTVALTDLLAEEQEDISIGASGTLVIFTV